ncbi:MAG TPA: molybdenum cofactor guanylyltransferase [Candidatus Acidoferrum sp.]|nr:molybdenum cofactor guanylyltransferase [Candidatus Acidoferrum sp.]
MKSDEQMAASQGPKRPIAGYVLAGGASRRFGKDKALAELGGKPMLERMLEMVERASVAEGGNRTAAHVIGAEKIYGKFGRPCVEDRWPGEGPLGGIITALLDTRTTTPGCERNLVVSCDMPFLTLEWLEFLIGRAEHSKAQVVLAHSSSGPEPLCACWKTDATETLLMGFEGGLRKVTDGIALIRAEILDEGDWKRFDSFGRLFWNMNTAQDYEEARRILAK